MVSDKRISKSSTRKLASFTTLALPMGALLGVTAALNANLVGLLLASLPFAIVGLFLPAHALALCAVAAALFSRTFVQLGLPEALNFLHFPIAFLALVRVLLTRGGSKLSTNLGFSIVASLGTYLVSGFFSRTPILVSLAGWVIIGEPLILLYVLLRDPLSEGQRGKIVGWLFAFAGVQLPIALWQSRFGFGDWVQGTLVGAGAGAHLLGAVGAIAATFVLSMDISQRWKRAKQGIAAVMLFLGVMADAKQVLGVYVLAYLATGLLSSWRKWGKALMGATALVVFLYLSSLFYKPLAVLFRLDQLYAGVSQKLKVFSMLSAAFSSVPAWSFGVGPGASASRLALMAMDGYGRATSITQGLGLKATPLTQAIWYENFSSPLSGYAGSSAWSLMFSWAGLLGDVGLVGVVCYLSGAITTWRVAKRTSPQVRDSVRQTLLFLAMLGGVYGFLEEPALTLFAAGWLGVALSTAQGAQTEEMIRPYRLAIRGENGVE